MAKFLKSLLPVWLRLPDPNNPKKPIKACLKDLKPGDYFEMDHKGSDRGFVCARCLNNEPRNKKLYISIKWTDDSKAEGFRTETLVLKYNDPKLINFSLLNTVVEYEKEEEDEEDNSTSLAKLQELLNTAIQKEDYTTARELQNKIDKLTKKNEKDKK